MIDALGALYLHDHGAGRQHSRIMRGRRSRVGGAKPEFGTRRVKIYLPGWNVPGQGRIAPESRIFGPEGGWAVAAGPEGGWAVAAGPEGDQRPRDHDLTVTKRRRS